MKLIGFYMIVMRFHMILHMGIYMTMNVRIYTTTNVRLILRMCGRDSECATGGRPGVGEPEGVPNPGSLGGAQPTPNLLGLMRILLGRA